MKLSDVRVIQKEVTRLATVLEALEAFQGADYERRVFERQVRLAGEALSVAVQAAGIHSRKEKRPNKISPALSRWRSERMKLFTKVQRSAAGSKERVEAETAYAAWVAANPVPTKAAAAK